MIRFDGLGGVGFALGAEKNILPHGKMGKQRSFLRHVADAPLSWREIDPARGRKKHSAIDLDFAVGDIAQAGNGVEQVRLA